MIINIIWVSSLMVAGYCARYLHEDVIAWLRRRRDQRNYAEIMRIEVGLSGKRNPEVDVIEVLDKEPLWDRTVARWQALWASTTPRTGKQVAEEARQAELDARNEVNRTRLDLLRVDIADNSARPRRYRGRHHASRTLKQTWRDEAPPEVEEVFG